MPVERTYDASSVSGNDFVGHARVDVGTGFSHDLISFKARLLCSRTCTDAHRRDRGSKAQGPRAGRGITRSARAVLALARKNGDTLPGGAASPLRRAGRSPEDLWRSRIGARCGRLQPVAALESVCFRARGQGRQNLLDTSGLACVAVVRLSRVSVGCTWRRSANAKRGRAPRSSRAFRGTVLIFHQGVIPGGRLAARFAACLTQVPGGARI